MHSRHGFEQKERKMHVGMRFLLIRIPSSVIRLAAACRGARIFVVLVQCGSYHGKVFDLCISAFGLFVSCFCPASPLFWRWSGADWALAFILGISSASMLVQLLARLCQIRYHRIRYRQGQEVRHVNVLFHFGRLHKASFLT